MHAERHSPAETPCPMGLGPGQGRAFDNGLKIVVYLRTCDLDSWVSAGSGRWSGEKGQGQQPGQCDPGGRAKIS